jgi:peptidoglycan hydrolase CwlO-like protein
MNQDKDFTGMIPWRHMGKKTINLVAVIVSLVVVAGPVTALYAIFQGNAAASRAEEARIETMKENAVMASKLKEMDHDLDIMAENLVEKNQEIVQLKSELLELRKQLAIERENFRVRENELVERIATLKLEDGKKGSFTQ